MINGVFFFFWDWAVTIATNIHQSYDIGLINKLFRAMKFPSSFSSEDGIFPL